MERHIVLDTETTGLSPKEHRIVEIAAARFNPITGEIEERLHHYLDPGMPVPAEATAIHGITDQMLSGKPTFKEVAEELSAFVAGSELIIHNASYDCGFLEKECKRIRAKPFKKLPREIICSRQLAKRVLPRVPASLDALCDHFGVDRSTRTLHGALLDCELLAQIYAQLVYLRSKRDADLQTMLHWSFGSDLPPDLETLGRGYVALAALINELKREQDRIKRRFVDLNGSNPYTSEDFTAKPGETIETDWEAVVEELLPGVDLSKYQEKGSSLTIRGT